MPRMKPSLEQYSLMLCALFWTTITVLYVFGISGGLVGILSIGIALLISHLFYKQQNRLMTAHEQLVFARKSIFNIITFSWIPLVLIYFFYLDEDKQELFISLFHPKVLPTAFVSIGIVSLVAFFGIWVTTKGYSYLLKRDIEKKA